MDLIHRFSAWPCCDPQDKTRQISRLYERERDTGRFIPGLVLEAQAQVGEFWALFLTYDCPFEEQLVIVYLDPALRMVDQATLSGLYTPGIFRVLPSAPPRSLNFEFIGTGFWSVEFFDRPHPRLPFFGEPSGVRRPFGVHRYFRLSHHRPAATP